MAANDVDQQAVAAFIARWRNTPGGAERANCQPFLIGLCHALGLEEPGIAQGGVLGSYRFEGPVAGGSLNGGPGFIDFYRTFFTQVSTRNAALPRDIYFPELVENKLQFNNDFLLTAKMVRERCIKDAKYANAIRWQPAFKQLIYRNDKGKLIVTISQNSIGNAITLSAPASTLRRSVDAATSSRCAK